LNNGYSRSGFPDNTLNNQALKFERLSFFADIFPAVVVKIDNLSTPVDAPESSQF
jgi:hypothetical protein